MAEPISHRGRSIFTTQTVSYVVIILMTTLTFSVLFFSTAKSQLEQEVGRKLQDIASIAAKNAPVERLELIKVGDEQTRKTYRRHGADGALFGVRWSELYALQKQIGVDHPLALALWETGNHDARTLATLVADPSACTAAHR